MTDHLLLSTDGHVGIARLNRPEVLNALSIPLMDDLINALEAYDKDPNIHCMLLAGSEKAFAAGADIGEMAEASVFDMNERDNLGRWLRIKYLKKPIVCAVSGYALGGGCELAMHCDILVASESAVFGQPEINIGVIPGAGGTQRMTRAVGKAKAMDVILTGRFLSAGEALEAGLVSRVVAKEQFYAESLRVAQEVASKPPLALKLAKEAVNKSFETSLLEGLEHERKLFYMLFATADQKEGMKAFQEKRKAVFKGK